MEYMNIGIEIVVHEDGSIQTTLTPPSLFPKPTTRKAASLTGSLAALDGEFNQLPHDPVRLTVSVASKKVRVQLVDLVIKSLICDNARLPGPLHPWHTLCLRTPDEHLSKKGPSRKRYPSLSPTELCGKTIVYSGGSQNLPFPWFTLGSLTRFGVEVVDIQRVITSAQLTHLIARAHCDDMDFCSFPLTLRMLGVVGKGGFDGPMDQKDWAEPVLNNSHYRLRAIDFGVVGRNISDVYFLVSAPMTQVTEVKVDVTRFEDDGVLTGIRMCKALKKLTVRCRAELHRATLRSVCEVLELSMATHMWDTVVIAEKRGLMRYI